MSVRQVELQKCDISDLETILLKDGLLQIEPAETFTEFTRNEVLYFMHTHGIYVMPTTELLDWLRENITGSAIEIGAGNGAIARALNIPITDIQQQADPLMRLYYAFLGAPVIKYPPDVEKLEALKAVKKYKPDTVIGAFITHRYNDITNDGNSLGPDEETMMKLIKRYINIGNLITHRNKPILRTHKHNEYYFDWLITRSIDQSKNRIFVFDNIS